MAEQNVMPDPMSTPIGGETSAPLGSNAAPFLPYHDLRQWLEDAKKLGEVKEVSGLSYQQDIGMVAEMSAHADDAPCFVFENVPGTLKGSRLLVNFFAGKRKNMTLGFSTELSKLELSESFRVNHAGMVKRIAPKFVDSGPVMQNIMIGDLIDVTKFPAPQWHPQDGGRYIGTGCYNIMRDPDDAILPTAAPSSTPAGRGTGATNSRRSTCRHRRSAASRWRSSGI
jgi:4-hydroxy-3-polyprenylbenzoate decarboxylase